MNKVFIFGTFNPVTNAHIQMGIVARYTIAAMTGQNCHIIYEPTSDEYIRSWKGYKEGSVLDAKTRVKLLFDAVSIHGFTVSTAEIAGFSDGKTYNTIGYYGFEDSVLCLGMDNIIQMKKWYKWQELLQKVRLLIFKREGYADGECANLQESLAQSREVTDILKHSCGYHIAHLPAGCDSISSTVVRECYINRDMERLETIVPSNVFKYLEENDHVYF